MAAHTAARLARRVLAALALLPAPLPAPLVVPVPALVLALLLALSLTLGAAPLRPAHAQLAPPSAPTAAPAAAADSDPAVALHYGAQPPIDALRAFDWVVLDPAHVADAKALPAPTRWFAYTSVGELDARRPYAAAMPSAWLRGENAAWGSRPVDHSAPGWPAFFAEQVIGPLWTQGWRAFFLDTLDSHRLFARTPAAQRAQEDALVAMVDLLHQRYPGIQLLFNRGFELLPRLPGRVAGVAAESLYRGWDQAMQRYVEVPEDDRRWLLAQLERVRREHRVPVVAIDYVAPAARALARSTAQQIRAAGVIPWVSNGALTTLGVGHLEAEPRRVLLLTDLAPGQDMQNSGAYRFLALPLHWLGYVIDAQDIRAPLPELDAGRHAAIVSWFTQPVTSLNPQYARWLKRQRDNGVRLVLLEQPGLEAEAPVLRELGLEAVRARGPVQIVQRPPWVGFETPVPQAGPPDVALRLAGSGERLRLRTADGTEIDAAALTPWGGFAIAPFVVRPPMLASLARWVIDPIAFLRGALQPAATDAQAPVPDVTTEAGRRLLFVHIDGDGFVSRAERPGAPFAGEVLLADVLKRRPIPHTVSVIQGEIAGNGMFAQLAPALEDIARRIFAQPNVEIASHSFSHPFSWRGLAQGQVEPSGGRGDIGPLNLMLPGYEFSLQAEIPGSVQYIDRTLAPSGKRTRVFLWTGDTVPTPPAVQLADATGVLNMNGGDTLITRSEPTLTAASGLGLLRAGALQVFAPMQNENLYTDNWTQRFYGFERVIETFELTASPLRLKPINIYYHTYSATKTASLTALNRVYDWAARQDAVPVYASDYIRKVIDFHALAIARDWRSTTPAWRVRGGGELRTLRVSAQTPVALGASSQVAGVAPGPQARYVHLAGADARVVLGTEPKPPVYVASARGWITDWQRSGSDLAFTLNSYTSAAVALGAAQGCRVRVAGQDSIVVHGAGDRLGITSTHEPKRSEHGTPPVAPADAPHRHLVDVRCP
jgi:hypothetical protein